MMNIRTIAASMLLLAAIFSTDIFAQKPNFDLRNTFFGIKESDTLRIDFISTPSRKVNIDGVWLSKYDKFTAAQRIELKENEYIEFTNKNTGRSQFKICGKDFIETKTSSISAFIIAKMACTKGPGGFGEFLSKFPWHMTDSVLVIPTNYILDDDHAFILKTIPGNLTLQPVPYDYTTNELYLSIDFFKENGLTLETGKDYQFRVEYWKGRQCSSVITDSFIIKCIPVGSRR